MTGSNTAPRLALLAIGLLGGFALWTGQLPFIAAAMIALACGASMPRVLRIVIVAVTIVVYGLYQLIALSSW